MGKFVIFAFFLTVLQLGHSLNCWKCNGCATARNNRETCKSVNPLDEEAVCLTQIVSSAPGEDPMIVKKCDYVSVGKQYTCRELPETSTIRCNICSFDYCNGTQSTLKTNSLFPIYVAFIILLIMKTT